ncbi:MAG: hypothetical protein GF364_22825 [Candidatus Lokiarchaeota archaeon]|nr:hypothetical protein [Candidatus Lokiarchaeota archaeon]
MSREILLRELEACGITAEVHPITLEVLSEDPVAVAAEQAHIRNREEYLQTDLNQYGPAQDLAALLTLQQRDNYRIVQLLEIRKRRREVVNEKGTWYLMKYLAGEMTQQEIVAKWNSVKTRYPYPAAYVALLPPEA